MALELSFRHPSLFLLPNSGCKNGKKDVAKKSLVLVLVASKEQTLGWAKNVGNLFLPLTLVFELSKQNTLLYCSKIETWAKLFSERRILQLGLFIDSSLSVGGGERIGGMKWRCWNSFYIAPTHPYVRTWASSFATTEREDFRLAPEREGEKEGALSGGRGVQERRGGSFFSPSILSCCSMSVCMLRLRPGGTKRGVRRGGVFFAAKSDWPGELREIRRRENARTGGFRSWVKEICRRYFAMNLGSSNSN